MAVVVHKVQWKKYDKHPLVTRLISTCGPGGPEGTHRWKNVTCKTCLKKKPIK